MGAAKLSSFRKHSAKTRDPITGALIVWHGTPLERRNHSVSYVLNPRRHGCGCGGDFDGQDCWNCGCNLGRRRLPRRDVFYTGPCPPDPECICRAGRGCGGGCGGCGGGCGGCGCGTGNCGRGGCGCQFAQCRDADCFGRCAHDCHQDCRCHCWRECGNDPECRARCELDCFAECNVACDNKVNNRCMTGQGFRCDRCGGHDRCGQCGQCSCQCRCGGRGLRDLDGDGMPDQFEQGRGCGCGCGG